jgi:hypothetical protein
VRVSLEKDEIRSIFREELQPVRDLVQAHDFILVGPNKDNGLVGDNKESKRRLETVERDITKFKAYAVAISGAVSTGFFVIQNVIKGVIGK